MTAHLSNASTAGASLRDIPKSNDFTSHLPADPEYPTPQDSHKAPREKLGPRLVKDALFTYVRPATVEEPELLAISPRAMQDIGIKQGEEETDEFKQVVAGNKILTWDEEKGEGIYPWAQCYGGWQFGSWAAQLGDGRAISLFETTNPSTTRRYEIQLKGAGKTPYSRFADGKAVVRSSIREFVVSEALNALNIPSTRALSLTLLPKDRIVRERIEPGAIVARFAESWLRIGTFDLLRSRGYRGLTRQLAEYVATNVFPGWSSLPSRIPEDTITESTSSTVDPARNVDLESLEGPEELQENRFARIYREIVRRNALTVAKWQAYAFTNGVLNTDNTSVFGLSIDFGPFAFLDNFDPSYTPNHDDHMLRYSYRNQPTIIWWNLVRLGEDLGELIGAGGRVDEDEFREKGVSKEFADVLIKRAEGIIERAGEEYKAVFMHEYKRLMGARLGLKQLSEEDFKGLLSDFLDTLEQLELDFNQSFRKLSHLAVSDLASDDQRKEVAKRFFHAEGITAIGTSLDDATARLGEWLGTLHRRWTEDNVTDEERQSAMKTINPKFIPKSWILDELIDRVEKKGEREVLDRVMKMALNPFEESWGGDAAEEERFCGDVPKFNRAMQCSCSS
ncbi:hypothetical protein FH972_022406 [Carpinus fangiana]|uniref:Selenoprotein O n=1 Tax=Carpinus fangiana TaxID=176857 RepID=A0A5N6KS63_9ROSI|nr:hypothetical protein FH972_022406 [Carpinus fangiana]